MSPSAHYGVLLVVLTQSYILSTESTKSIVSREKSSNMKSVEATPKKFTARFSGSLSEERGWLGKFPEVGFFFFKNQNCEKLIVFNRTEGEYLFWTKQDG